MNGIGGRARDGGIKCVELPCRRRKESERATDMMSMYMQVHCYAHTS
jgi:hypothetical protein